MLRRLSLLLFVLTLSARAEVPLTLKSPDGSVVATVTAGGPGYPECRITVDGKEVALVARLGLVAEGVHIGLGAKRAGEALQRTIDERYEWSGAYSQARNHCNELSIPLEKGGLRYSLIVRAFADGVGLCYDFGSREVSITGETTEWLLPQSGSYAWSPYSTGYEELYQVTPWSGIPAQRRLAPPLTAEVNGTWIAVTEADCRDFPDMGLLSDGHALSVAFPTQTGSWKSARSPWRVTIVARDLTALVNTSIVPNLCPPPETGRDFSWVQSGRVLWQWWSVGAPKLEEQKDWFDAAAALGWEFYLIDDGWRTWSAPGKDQWKCLEEVIAYGKTKGMKSIVWVDSKEMRDAPSRRAYLERVAAIGASGIKIDFLPAANAQITRWYQGALRDTADLKLLCNFHGAVKPSGQERTWPHNNTREAIRGHEYHILRYKRSLPLEMDAILPFTRLLAGAADYTPTVFEPAELRGYTWSHEFAQAIVYTSPLTHFADHYKNYLASPAFDLLREVPVVWDETIVLPGTRIGETAAFARRKGDVWWIGVMNGRKEANLSVPLDFLRGNVDATLLADKPGKADAFDRSAKPLTPKDTLSITMPPGGGFVGRLVPVKR